MDKEGVAESILPLVMEVVSFWCRFTVRKRRRAQLRTWWKTRSSGDKTASQSTLKVLSRYCEVYLLSVSHLPIVSALPTVDSKQSYSIWKAHFSICLGVHYIKLLMFLILYFRQPFLKLPTHTLSQTAPCTVLLHRSVVWVLKLQDQNKNKLHVSKDYNDGVCLCFFFGCATVTLIQKVDLWCNTVRCSWAYPYKYRS